MANVEYTTMAAVSTTSSGGWPRVFNVGSGLMVERAPNLGDKTTFKDTVRWTVDDSGFISDAGTCKISGTNLKDSYQSLRFGNEGCIYPPAKFITGFQMANQTNQLGGHGMYLRRMGLIFRNKNGTELFWGSEARARPNTTAKETWVHQISQTDINTLSGYVVDSLVVEISSKTGSGQSTSQVTLGGFKLFHSVAPANMRWVVGAMRERSQIFGEGSMQFN